MIEEILNLYSELSESGKEKLMSFVKKLIDEQEKQVNKEYKLNNGSLSSLEY